MHEMKVNEKIMNGDRERVELNGCIEYFIAENPTWKWFGRFGIKMKSNDLSHKLDICLVIGLTGNVCNLLMAWLTKSINSLPSISIGNFPGCP